MQHRNVASFCYKPCKGLCKKGRDFISFCCTYIYLRHKHEIPRFFGVYRGEFLPYALGESRVPTHEIRDVGTQCQAQHGQSILIPTQLPEMIEAEQSRRGI